MHNNRFLLVNKGIQQYVRSVHILIATVIALHILFVGYFYPMVVIIAVFLPATFFILYKWIELVYEIEQSNRLRLLELIGSAKHESTRKILIQELVHADLHSLGATFFEDEHRYQ